MGLRLLVFDRTCRWPRLTPTAPRSRTTRGSAAAVPLPRSARSPAPSLGFLPLTHVWRAGEWLYRNLGRIDLALGAASWEEALRWLGEVEAERAAAIDEIQIWSHGRWGRVLLENDVLDRQILRVEHSLHAQFRTVRDRLLPGSLLWFRTCETFGACAGQHFASELVDFLGCRAAGHTHIIGFWQSGLHSLVPGETPAWPASEGIAEGSPEEPVRARPSAPGAPNTITCLHGRVPPGF